MLQRSPVFHSLPRRSLLAVGKTVGHASTKALRAGRFGCVRSNETQRSETAVARVRVAKTGPTQRWRSTGSPQNRRCSRLFPAGTKRKSWSLLLAAFPVCLQSVATPKFVSALSSRPPKALPRACQPLLKATMYWLLPVRHTDLHVLAMRHAQEVDLQNSPKDAWQQIALFICPT